MAQDEQTEFMHKSSVAVQCWWPEQQEEAGQELTWPAEMCVLILLIHTHPQAPGVVGKRKEILWLGGAGDGSSQPLQPLLALLERGEMAPANPKANHPQGGLS